MLLAVALIGVLPLSWWLRDNPRHNQKIWVLVGFLPICITAIPHSNIAVISWPAWPGFVKGAEISGLDFILFALWLSLPRGRRINLPFKASMLLYFFAVALSIFSADIPEAAMFYLWQLARMFFVYTVVARASTDTNVTESILTGMLLGLCYEGCVVVWQRFGLGAVQTTGTFGGQNSLGMISHLVVFPLFALFLAGKKGWQPIVAPFVGIFVAILTVSRATVGLAGLAYFILFGFSALRQWTARLAKIALVGSILLAALAPFAISSFERRFALEPHSDSYDERAAFENATKMMLFDHPLGVGANNFVVVANTRGYFDRAGVASVFESRSAHVHNAYLLAAAETGYYGAVAFVLMLAQPMIAAFRSGWRSRRDKRGDLLLGLGVGLLSVYLQSFYEWTFFLFYSQYMFVITIGMVAGLVHQLSNRPLASSKDNSESDPLNSSPKGIWLR